jgi:hypothetical protein
MFTVYFTSRKPIAATAYFKPASINLTLATLETCIINSQKLQKIEIVLNKT